MAMTEVLEALPEDYARRQEVINLLQKAMTEVVKHQDKKTGVWYDVLDVKDERNYLEASCSAMFAYVLLKGSRMGWLDESFKQAGVRAFNGIVKEFVRVNADKTISLTRCCEVSGLGPDNNRRRDGSFEYYISEPIRDNDAKGVGPFIWAALEMERL
jgi:rhamnogalacturonyl hydrolase YesR